MLDKYTSMLSIYDLETYRNDCFRMLRFRNFTLNWVHVNIIVVDEVKILICGRVRIVQYYHTTRADHIDHWTLNKLLIWAFEHCIGGCIILFFLLYLFYKSYTRVLYCHNEKYPFVLYIYKCTPKYIMIERGTRFRWGQHALRIPMRIYY